MKRVHYRPLVIGFVLLFPLFGHSKESSVTQLFNVQVVKVKKERRQERRTNYGYVKADENSTYDVTPRFGGYVVTLYADSIYKKVKKGDPLVTVYSPEVYKAKDEYLNSYQYFQKRLNSGMLESAKEKLEFLGIAKKEIDEIIKKRRSSELTTIYAPVDGYIFIKNVTHGSAFAAKQNLFQIVNLDRVWIEVRIFQEQLEQLSDKCEYEVTFKEQAKIYKATRAELYPNLSPKEATATLRLVLQNEEHRLIPGMYASIESVSNEKEYLLLPSTAVIRKNSRFYAYVPGEYEGEYEPREVSVTRLDAKSYSIESGLDEGDEVVNNALFMIDSDAQINGLY